MMMVVELVGFVFVTEGRVRVMVELVAAGLESFIMVLEVLSVSVSLPEKTISYKFVFSLVLLFFKVSKRY